MTKLTMLATFIATASAVVLPRADIPTGAPPLPASAFNTNPFPMKTPEELLAIVRNGADIEPPTFVPSAGQATCSSPRTRPEWHSATDAQKQKWVDAIKCLYSRPSKGGFNGSKNRYEDFVQVHQVVADNVHNNAKFLPWHRAYMWAFEETLRSECGYTESMPWFDETRYAGKFATSSIFSNQWLGAISLPANTCVTNGQFANLALNLGPGRGNSFHCLTRQGDGSVTANANTANANNCASATDYQVFAACHEGFHSYGHNGVGGTMRDFYTSPSDPFFWLHHGMVDRMWRVWQNKDPARVSYVDGNAAGGVPLTMETSIVLNGLKPNLQVKNVMNTMGDTLCYKYDY